MPKKVQKDEFVYRTADGSQHDQESQAQNHEQSLIDAYSNKFSVSEMLESIKQLDEDHYETILWILFQDRPQ